jgi:HrpA-like RNA helicase
LKAPGFNPWNLKCDILVSKFAFKFNLYRYNEAPPGAVLVFLPGIGEVTSLLDRLTANPRFAPRHRRHRLVPLHSALSAAEQREAFKVFPGDVRKIVVATNVAETSVGLYRSNAVDQ